MDLCEAKGFDDENVARHPWELARLKVVKDLLTPLCKSKTVVNILDVGCGDVYVAQNLSTYFPNAVFHCIDIAFTEEVKQVLQQRVVNCPIKLYSSFEELKSTNIVPNADIVLLLDVIEHIDDEIGFMKYMDGFGLITEQTNVIITVPAFQNLFSNHDVYLKHFRRYNLPLLTNHLNQANYKVVKNGYFFFALLIPRILQKLIQSKSSSNSEVGIGVYVKKPVVDSILVGVLFADYLVCKMFNQVRIKIPGLSCFAICQKQLS